MRKMAVIALLLLLAASPLGAQDADIIKPAAVDPTAIRGAAAIKAADSATPAATESILKAVDLQKTLIEATSKEKVSSTLQIVLLLTVLALVPSILVMMTSFTRIIIVLGLLRQAMATQQLPPNQVLIGLALFMTFVVMAPVYNEVHDTAIRPYVDGEITQSQALQISQGPIRKFMRTQIEAGNNTDDVYLFLSEELAVRDDLKWRDVPTMTLIPAYVISELKIAFMMGFRIYLPFLIIDMVIASMLISMGMMMLPPVLISLPFKLLLFVLADGWHLVVRTLMLSFG